MISIDWKQIVEEAFNVKISNKELVSEYALDKEWTENELFLLRDTVNKYLELHQSKDNTPTVGKLRDYLSNFDDDTKIRFNTKGDEVMFVSFVDSGLDIVFNLF